MLSNLRIGTEKWFDALRRSTDKPKMEYGEDQNETIIYNCAVQRHSHGTKINPALLSKERQFMNHERYCASTVIGQIMIVFIFSLKDDLNTQILVFHQRSSDTNILNDNMSASAVDKWSISQVKLCSKENPRL